MLGYLDAGSGSVIVAAIVAGVAGIGVFFRMLWQRIRHPFAGGKRAEETDATGDADEQATSEADTEVRASDHGAQGA
jgi:hypothetical protein